MTAYLSTDVIPAVAARQTAHYRAMSPSEKLVLADGLWDLAWDATTVGVRMRHPALDDAAVAACARRLLRDASD